MPITTIQIDKSTHSNLDKIGRRGESYDDIVSFLIKLYHFVSKTREELEHEIIEKEIAKE